MFSVLINYLATKVLKIDMAKLIMKRFYQLQIVYNVVFLKNGKIVNKKMENFNPYPLRVFFSIRFWLCC